MRTTYPALRVISTIFKVNAASIAVIDVFVIAAAIDSSPPAEKVTEVFLACLALVVVSGMMILISLAFSELIRLAVNVANDVRITAEVQSASAMSFTATAS